MHRSSFGGIGERFLGGRDPFVRLGWRSLAASRHFDAHRAHLADGFIGLWRTA